MAKQAVSVEVRLSSAHLKALEIIAEDYGFTLEKMAAELLSTAIEEDMKLRLDEIFKHAGDELEEEDQAATV